MYSTEVLRQGARRLLAETLEVEVEAFIEEYKDYRLSDGCRRIVRNGYHKAREIQTGIGEIIVKVPRAEDRGEGGEKIRLQSSIVPPYLRRTKSIESLLPLLYLKGISTGDFPEALEALLGKEPVALEDGYRESEQSWEEVLMDLKNRGLKQWPKVAVGDGAMGF
jgi:transposase-like protein